MRALGPGSVSSFLKVILDVFFYVLWVSAGIIGAAILGLLLISFNPGVLSAALKIDSLHLQTPNAVPIATAVVAGVELYLVGVILIVGRLRRIFATMTAGDPFHPDNVRRLRVIAGVLALLEVGRYMARGMDHVFLGGVLHIGGGLNLTAWFAVLVILVLSEVFREGARLRRDAELTI
jgi:hypothetical protein